jgi:hypothetical protein
VPGSSSGYGHSCMDLNGDCKGDAFLSYGIFTDSDPFLEFSLHLSLPAGATPAYDLPTSGPEIEASLCPHGDPSYQCTALSVVGGRIVVEQNTERALQASFAMTLETPAHERYSLSGGSAKISGCRVDSQTTCKL